MEARLNPFAHDTLMTILPHVISAGRAASGALPERVAELVNIRASQINGCGACLDMHVKEALHAGETPLRVNLVGAWRETTVFTEQERAALALTEEGTRLADSTGVSDETWSYAAHHFDESTLGALVAQIALINTFNRFNVITRQQGGHYEVGQIA